MPGLTIEREILIKDKLLPAAPAGEKDETFPTRYPLDADRTHA